MKPDIILYILARPWKAYPIAKQVVASCALEKVDLPPHGPEGREMLAAARFAGVNSQQNPFFRHVSQIDPKGRLQNYTERIYAP